MQGQKWIKKEIKKYKNIPKNKKKNKEEAYGLLRIKIRSNKKINIAELSCPQVGTGDFIPENIVYPLIGKAKNVLVEIRKTGMYATDELLDNPYLLLRHICRK